MTKLYPYLDRPTVESIRVCLLPVYKPALSARLIGSECVCACALKIRVQKEEKIAKERKRR